MPYYTYILASKKNGTIYTGVTSDLVRRVYQHKAKQIKGFTSKYNVTQLVYFEMYENIMDAIAREKRMKRLSKALKLSLIEKGNPHWKDLYETL